ncbi:MAG TPA: DUF488 domain-containing protein [Allosphingosinicella sp.]|nr:DUF488 domain-containing protein [Allosphingosinicella sp.]
MITLFTIGYEGASLPDFIETLRLARVQHVLDVRDVPQSRRAGFSKKGLAAALADQGFSYSHAKQLGDPKAGREAARRGDLEAFRRIFEAHLALEETQIALLRAAHIASERATVLLCFERDPSHCHRTLVARSINELCSLNVQNLGVVHNASRRDGAFRKAA